MISKTSLKLYNTLKRQIEIFKPIKDKKVGLYTCGITAYFYPHIGNLRTYIFEDILKRVLKYNGFKVKHVMNITDVGHLVSDEDIGEDKILLAAKREKKSPKEVARFYEKEFKKDLKRLNILEPDVWIRATETIQDQINFIKVLEKKGFTYITQDGVYFDTSKLKKYGRLWPKEMEILPGARVEVSQDKKNPADFALWKFAKERKEMIWDSPWGKGFPGWHTECVVMATKELGIPFDIHCGGVDHILIHHTNEIAQGEAVFGKILANFWLHGEFLLVEGKKMAKSEGNIFTLNDLIQKGFHPLSFRYLCLLTHYRKPLNFSFSSLLAAQNALIEIYQKLSEIKTKKRDFKRKNFENFRKQFLEIINDDLNIPKAIGFIQNLLNSNALTSSLKYHLLIDFDKVFGLNFAKVKKLTPLPKIKSLLLKREAFRNERKFKEADKLREKILKMGYAIEDTKAGPRLKLVKIEKFF